MDSSEAGFYGLTTANLEDANGDFVSPTPASLEAAEGNLTACPALDALTCPTGSYQVDYSTPVPDAYPLPDVTYAVVPTAARPADTAAAETALLTNLVNYSHSSATPAGGLCPPVRQPVHGGPGRHQHRPGGGTSHHRYHDDHHAGHHGHDHRGSGRGRRHVG